MINEKAAKIAKDVPKEEQHSKTIENLEASTKLLDESSKQLEKELAIADKMFYTLVESAEPKDQQKVLKTVQQAKALIAQIKNGADANDIVKKLNNLK